jgi:tRNA threonylcarbamoyladenosine biosynthesis protein TsaE
MQNQAIPQPGEFTHFRLTDSADQTAALGRQASGLLRGGEVILLNGALGAGKTCFIQGLCQGLRVAEEVVSPTFTLVNTYQGRLKVHHLDFYRVEEGDSLEDIGVPDFLDEVWDGAAVLLVEWPEPLLAELGAEQRRLELLAVAGENPDQRRWCLRGIPEVPAAWQEIFNDKPEGGQC